jgi:regulator of protease activity HflC (stomatin/prohibitin superfamily)
MFDKLIDVLLQFLDLFRGWVVVREGGVAVIYTLGRPTRVCRADDGWFWTGFHPKLCLGIDKEDDTSVRDDVMPLLSQDLTTCDGHKVRVAGAFTVAVDPDKIVTWQTTLGDEDRALPSSLRAAIGETIARRTVEELFSADELKDVRQEILDRARKSLNKYGYRIKDFQWIERIEARVLRVITGE